MTPRNAAKKAGRKSAKKKAVGRPTRFKPEYVQRGYDFALLGATDKQIAERLKVSEVTLNAWKKAYPEFLKSLNKGKDEADALVVKSLFHRARGYSHKAIKIFCNKDGEVTEVPYVERYPPDTTAAIFWLKNRQPTSWRDRMEVTHSADAELTAAIAAGDKTKLRAIAEGKTK